MIMAVLTHWVSVNDARAHLPASPRQPGWHHFLPGEHLLGREGWCRPPQEPAPLRNHKCKINNTFLSPQYLCTCIDGVQTHTMHLNTIWLKTDKLAGSLTLRGQKTIPKHPDSSNSYSSFIRNPGDDLMHDLMFFCARFQSWACYPWQQTVVGISTKNKLKFGPKGGLPFCSLCSQDLFKHEHVQAYGLNNSK